MPPDRFLNRREAGRQLAALLEIYRDEKPLVLALPRGGVPVGYEIAVALEAPLDVVVARKLGAPFQPELGIGAIAQGGVVVYDVESIRALGITREEVERTAEAETQELERRVRRFRGDRPPPEIRGRTVILVDDGLATGVTAYAAIESVLKQEPESVILAAPVCAAPTAAAMKARLTDVICVKIPLDLMAVGLWYRDFEQTTDDEVVALLSDARERYTKANPATNEEET